MKNSYRLLFLAVMVSGLVSLSMKPGPGSSGNAGLSSTLVSQDQGHEYYTGERPTVNLSEVPDEAFEPGKIRVKFKPAVEDKFRNTLMRGGPSGTVAVAHAGIDQLNRQYGIREYRALLHHLYQIAPPSASKSQKHRKHGLHLWFELTLGSATAVRNAVAAFSRLPEVDVAEPVYRKRMIEPISVRPVDTGSGLGIAPSAESSPDDYLYGFQWGFKNTGQNINGITGTPGADISAEPAWAVIKGNPDVVVAVFDEGIQYDHPDLAANVWPGIGPDGTNTLAGNHGTHVAGTIAAVSFNGTGVAGTAGGNGSANTGVKVMSLDIFDGSHGMNYLELNVWAADRGAAISQNSWGYTIANVYNDSDLDGIDYFNAYGGGNILLDGGITVFAAGNDNSSANWYPGCYPGTVAVAATDNKDIKSDFSNYGTWIDLAAPGTDIASLGAANEYYWMSGTSMACPHVSGVAALVLSYAPGVMTNRQLWDLLKASADNIDATNPAYIGKLGSGRLNAQKALELAGAYLGGTPGPASFTAQAITESSVQLNWELNSANHPVLVAWSPSGTFGSPVNGTTYSAGDNLPGGGTVLYYGSGTGFLHSGLNFATAYYYRAWSYGGTEYSMPVSAGAVTPCPAIQPLPFAQNFNAAQSIPPCWGTSGSAVWKVGAFASGITSPDGNYAWTEISGNAASNGQLISPVFDFSGKTDVQLSFRHNYNHNRSSATLSYSLNGGSSWNIIQNWTASTTTETFSRTIAALAGQSNVQFRWDLNFTGGGSIAGKRSWSVDDVTVNAAGPAAMWKITATAGTGGAIAPSGEVSVVEGASQTFTIMPSAGYQVEDVRVDGASVGPVTSYTFSNVTADHAISAGFSEMAVEPCLVQVLPYQKDFNAAALLPDCWSSAGTSSWLVGRLAKGGLNTTGNYAYVTLKGKSALHSELYSTTFDFTNYTGITLAFKHYYLHNASTAKLYYSSDGGASWTLIDVWNATTSNPVTFSRDISEVAGEPVVTFKWELTYPGGAAANSTRSWFVDDISVTGRNASQASIRSAGSENFISERVEVYPNPAQGMVHISVSSGEAATALFINDTGQVIRVVSLNGSINSIPTGDLGRGLYILQIRTAGNLHTKKLIVQ